MYSMQNEWKSVVVERFIRTLKNKIDKYMTSVSNNVYIDKLHDIMIYDILLEYQNIKTFLQKTMFWRLLWKGFFD